MPLTKSGKEVLSGMSQKYGAEKGKQVFYASINKGKAGSSKWHAKRAAVKNRLKKTKGRMRTKPH